MLFNDYGLTLAAPKMITVAGAAPAPIATAPASTGASTGASIQDSVLALLKSGALKSASQATVLGGGNAPSQATTQPAPSTTSVMQTSGSTDGDYFVAPSPAPSSAVAPSMLKKFEVPLLVGGAGIAALILWNLTHRKA